MSEEGMFELNGFAMNLTFYAGLLEKLGVKPQTVRAGRFKGAVEPYLRSDLSPDNEAQLQALVDDVESVFVHTIAQARGLSAEAVEALSDRGSIVTTREALAAGLIDGYAFDDEVALRIRTRIGGDVNRDLRTVKLTDYARAGGGRNGNAGTIAVVHADGTILPGKTPSSPLLGGSASAIGSASFVEAMDDARQDEKVDAIVLRINSPGGFAPAADEMRAAILRAAQEKPLYVSMADVAASGGYWIAASADTIVAESLTLTGSIGVFGLFFDVSDAFEDHLGITFDGVRTGPSADMFSGLRELSPEERRHMEAMTDRTYEQFLKIVAEGRSMTVEEVDAIAQGRVWTGQDALEVGLVDVIGGLDTAIALAAGAAGLDPETVRIRELPRPASIMEQFSGSLAASVSSRMGLPVLSEADAVRVEAMRLMEHPGPYVLLPYRLTWD